MESLRIAGVILVILLLFGLCMASSLGLGSEGVQILGTKLHMSVGARLQRQTSKLKCVWYHDIPWDLFVFCDIWLNPSWRPGELAQHKRRWNGTDYELLQNFFACYFVWSKIQYSSRGMALHDFLVLWRLSTSDWLIALALGTGLMLLQLYAFYHTGCLGSFIFFQTSAWMIRGHREGTANQG